MGDGTAFPRLCVCLQQTQNSKAARVRILMQRCGEARRKLTTPKLARLSTVGSKRDSVELLDRPPRSELPRTTMLHTLGDENGDPLSRMEFDNRVCVWETL